ncbi:hypothetical protein NQ318_004122, partial [Aromia moschata]
VLQAVPQIDVTDVLTNKLSHYHDLQQRTHQLEGVKVGDLVLLRGENTQPMNWPLGRITHSSVTHFIPVKMRVRVHSAGS